MKKHILFGAALLVLAAACNKNMLPETPEAEPAGVPMTLTASIGGPGTKVSYTDDEANKVLKTAWEAGDKVSVVSIGSDNTVIANDIFETSTAGKSVEFTGTFTGGDSAEEIMVYYPALTESYEKANDSNTYWRVPSYNNGYTYDGILSNLSVGRKYFDTNYSYYQQPVADSPSHLKNLMVLSGEGDLTDIASGKLTVTLEHNMYVLKIKMTNLTPGDNLYNVYVYGKTSDDKPKDIGGCGWGYAYTYGGRPAGNFTDFIGIELGAKTGYTFGGFDVPASGEMTVYIPVPTGTAGKFSFVSGDKFTIEAKNSSTLLSKDLTFTSDRTLERGYVYPVNVAF